MKWMGAPEQRNSPLYNLKRNYRYDVDRNSGSNKTRFEKFMDSIEDSSKKWIVGVMIAIVGALILNLLHIK